jgi:hypothetical protein
MPLLTFWKSSPQAVGELSIEQVVGSAGDGMLRDSSECSREFREYLSQIPSSKIANYAEHCLASSFTKGGLVLQDLVNELGRRLDYAVTNGRYQGTTTAIGFDGTWSSPEQHTLIVEVKTTDAYRISLDTIASYRDRLVAQGSVSGPVSILIVVGREDTGELEAQIRGSRHAWDIRLISTDALIKLVQLKENAESSDTGLKIRSLLTPMEYTRLDRMIDVMFATAREVEAATSAEEPEEDEQPGIAPAIERQKGVWQFTDSRLLQNKRDEIVAAVGNKLDTAFIKRSRALYWNAGHDKRLVCTISKRYAGRASYPYWFAYHPQWDQFLHEAEESFLVLGCMDLAFAFALPGAVIHDSLGSLNTTTTKDDHTYWHLHVVENEDGQYCILLPKKSSTLAINGYRMDVPTPVRA